MSSTRTRSAQTDVHMHVPAGAVPKDGPSAGVAIAAALLSLFRQQAIRWDLAMTGELTLTGRVLPVGGVREKVLAARRAGIKRLILPRHNDKDLIELPDDVKNALEFEWVDTLDQVVPLLFAAGRRRGNARSRFRPARRRRRGPGHPAPGRRAGAQELMGM